MTYKFYTLARLTPDGWQVDRRYIGVRKRLFALAKALNAKGQDRWKVVTC